MPSDPVPTFHYDKERETWVCPKCGDVGDDTAWLPCGNGCDEGYFDGYEEDPLWYDEGDMYACEVCEGKGGWRVCGKCNADNEDAEF
jgi:hypothetical protein